MSPIKQQSLLSLFRCFRIDYFSFIVSVDSNNTFYNNRCCHFQVPLFFLVKEFLLLLVLTFALLALQPVMVLVQVNAKVMVEVRVLLLRQEEVVKAAILVLLVFLTPPRN